MLLSVLVCFVICMYVRLCVCIVCELLHLIAKYTVCIVRVKIIVSKVASTPNEVETYAQCTLLAASLAASDEGSASKLSAVKACVEYLQENEFIARRAVTGSGNLRSAFFVFLQYRQ